MAPRLIVLESDVMTALPDWDLVGDAELVSAAAAGDRAAFAGIYDRYADRLHDFCVGMVRDRDTAADCVQEVFCTAALQLAKLRDPDKLRPWLYTIARNEALRHIRDRRREHVSDELPDAASPEAGPDTVAARGELADLIASAAGGLSDRDRTVLELAYRHGLDGPELAQALGVSAGTANKMVSRLRQTIEHSLGALLVARAAHHNRAGCLELGRILADWDGRFSILMRKRIARHIESCPTCEQERRRLVNPAALLGAVPVFIPAPGWLRDHTLGQIQLTSATLATNTGTGSSPGTDGRSGLDSAYPPSAASSEAVGVDNPIDRARDGHNRRVIQLVVLFAGTLLISLGLTLAWLHHHKVSISPTEVSKIAPTATNPGAPPTGGPSSNHPPVPPVPPTNANTTVPVSTAPPANPHPPIHTPTPTLPTVPSWTPPPPPVSQAPMPTSPVWQPPVVPTPPPPLPVVPTPPPPPVVPTPPPPTQLPYTPTIPTLPPNTTIRHLGPPPTRVATTTPPPPRQVQ